jgi:hypothetical protein
VLAIKEFDRDRKKSLYRVGRKDACCCRDLNIVLRNEIGLSGVRMTRMKLRAFFGVSTKPTYYSTNKTTTLPAEKAHKTFPKVSEKPNGAKVVKRTQEWKSSR